WLYLIGRIKPGATTPQIAARAATELQAWLAAQSFLGADDRKQIDRQHIPVVTASGGVMVLQYEYQRPLPLLFATSLLVLLLAAAWDEAQGSVRFCRGARWWWHRSRYRLWRSPVPGC